MQVSDLWGHAFTTPADTIYVATGSPMPAYVGLLLAGLTLAAIVWQAVIYSRQATLMKTAQDERVRAAASTLYRAAYDLVDEFRKADGIAVGGGALPVNFETHPRQLMRTAGQIFAPLSNQAVAAVNQAARGVDVYFEQVAAWNAHIPENRDGVRLRSINLARRNVGVELDRAQDQLTAELRAVSPTGHQPLFRELCAHPSDRV